MIVDTPDASLVEATVLLSSGEVATWERIDAARPPLGFDETFTGPSKRSCTSNDQVRAALAAPRHHRPRPGPDRPVAHRELRRSRRGGAADRPLHLLSTASSPSDNGYARPIEGLLVVVDMAPRRGARASSTTDPCPCPTSPAATCPRTTSRSATDLRRLDIDQPDGVSFTVDGHVLRWQRWSLHVSLDPLEGLVLHTVGYDDDGRTRPILHRASISEMVVPYGDPDPAHGWKNAFDVGEWGLGRMANSLALGCDCLGEILYLDAVLADEQGRPATTANAICIHEEDVGILWKHVDLHAGRTEVRRSRRLVVSSIATVGNYEYGFYWYFYLDGSLELEVKLTGILSTKAVADGGSSAAAPMIAAGSGRPAAPAPVLRPARHGGRRAGQRGARGRRGADGGRRRRTAGATASSRS